MAIEDNPEAVVAMLFNWFDPEEDDVEYYYNLLTENGFDVTLEDVEDAVRIVREVLGVDPDEPLRPEDEPLV